MNLTISYRQHADALEYEKQHQGLDGLDDFCRKKAVMDAMNLFVRSNTARRLRDLGAIFGWREWTGYKKVEVRFENECEAALMEVLNMAILPQCAGLWNEESRVLRRHDIFDKRARLEVPLGWMVDEIDMMAAPLVKIWMPKWVSFRIDQFSLEHKLCRGTKAGGRWRFSTQYGDKVRAGRLWLTDEHIGSGFEEKKRMVAEDGFPPEAKRGELLEPLFRKLDESEEECMFRIDGRAVIRRMNARDES